MQAQSGEEYWFLVLSIQNSDGPVMLYIVGNFDGEKFTERDPQKPAQSFDYGNDFYAAQSWYGTKSRTIWIAWANHWRYSSTVPTDPWSGTMTLPRSLTPVEEEAGVILIQKPVEEVEELRGEAVEIEQDVLLHTECAHEYQFVLNHACGGKMQLRVTTASDENIFMEWDGTSTRFTLNRAGLILSEFDPFFQKPMTVTFSEEELAEDRLFVRMILDNSILELFFQNGEKVITAQVFPTTPFTNISYTCSGQTSMDSAMYYPLISQEDTMGMLNYEKKAT